MGRLIIIALIFVLPASLAFPSGAPGAQPQLGSEAALVMDTANGQVLYHKDGDKKMYPASTTKILTAVLALEKGNLRDLVTVPREACLVDGSRIGLQEGEQLYLEDLLYALMLESANDAAVSIAYYIAGSVPEFSLMMNNKARELGAVNSNFVNPNGLPDENHFTTARDLAIIACYAMQNPEFRGLVSTRVKVISRSMADRSKGPPQEHFWNHNRHLSLYQGATGIKTGYTSQSGQCLVASAKRDDRELIAIVLNCQGTSPYTDAGILLDYGFNNFVIKRLVESGEKITTLDVKNGDGQVDLVAAEEIMLNFPLEADANIIRKVELGYEPEAPLTAGEKMGNLIILDGEREIARADLLSLNGVDRKLSSNWWFWAAALVPVFIVVRSRIIARRRRALRRARAKRYQYE